MSMLVLQNMSFKAGQVMKIKGVPKSDAAGFSINVGHSEDQVALHFNPRFDAGGDHKTIVCNSFQDGSWNAEHRDGAFPFQCEEMFKMSISFDNDEFRINLPDGHVVQFPNRVGDDKYKFIFVRGDVKIRSFDIK